MIDIATAVVLVYAIGVVFTAGVGVGEALSYARPDYTKLGLVAVTWPVWLLIFVYKLANA